MSVLPRLQRAVLGRSAGHALSSTRRTSCTSCVNVKDARPTPHVSRRMDDNKYLRFCSGFGLHLLLMTRRAWCPVHNRICMHSCSSEAGLANRPRHGAPRPQPVSTGQSYCIDDSAQRGGRMGPCGGDPAHRVVHAQAYTTHLNPPRDLESRRDAKMEGIQSASQSSRPLACTVQQPATDESRHKKPFWKRERTQAQQKSA